VATASALSTTTSVRVTGGWRSVTEHMMRAYRRIWLGSAISNFLTPLMYLGGMGFGLGLLVDQASGGIGGVPYVAFVAPGVLAATAVQVAAGETTFPVMAAIKWIRTYHGMLATPLRVREIVVGTQVYVLLRVTLASAVFLLVAVALGAVRSWWALASLPLAVLGGMSFATCSYAFSARLINERGLTLLFRFVVMPMILFSGTFFPITQLPGWLQPVAWATPLWHAVDACRALTLGTATLGGVLGHVGYLLVWLVVGQVLSVRVLRRRMVI
jgi:lipooligosaccharide transport system permease protein